MSSNVRVVESATHSTQKKTADQRFWQYCEVRMVHSVIDCPEQWAPALQLVLEAAQSQRCVTFDDATPENAENSVDLDESMPRSHVPTAIGSPLAPVTADACDDNKTHGVTRVSTPLPQPLPLNCIAPHSHQWSKRNPCEGDSQDVANVLASSLSNGRIKVVALHGVVYR